MNERGGRGTRPGDSERTRRKNAGQSSLADVADDPSDAPTDDAIRARAYEIYLTRGPNDGDHLTDWLAAERELRRRRDGSTSQ